MPENRENASKFVTNQQELLSELMKKIMPGSEKFDFLVGYFYFSGFDQISSGIGLNTPMRILVGMEAEATMAGTIREIHERSFERTVSATNAEERERYAQNLVDATNSTDLFDSTERERNFRFFLDKLRNGSLQIKKTAEPNHAKMYLFEYQKNIVDITNSPGVVITGSSNLTWSGLSDRFEVNVILRDAHDYVDAEKIFKTLWDASIPLVDETTKDEFFTKIEKTWVFQLPKPYLMFIRVLDEYFSVREERISLPDRITNGKYFTTAYQTDAIRQGVAMLKNHSGCIVADVVGLGKSIIAAAIAHNRNQRAIVICPPHLEQQWDDYLLDFQISGDVFTSGKIAQALAAARKSPGKKTIIIDEAHRYRNEATIDYGLLHKTCVGNEVLLLTATPFNNRPSDLFSLVKLFQIPAKPTIRTTDNLASAMYELVRAYKAVEKKRNERETADARREMEIIAGKIRELLSPLVIRRTRLDLEKIESYRSDLAAKGISFSRVNDPEELDYDLGPLSELYSNTLEKIGGDGGFRAARYKPLTYLKPGAETKYIEDYFGERNLMEKGQMNLALFMKRLLVRRFESSITAFRSTLGSLVRSGENTLLWLDKFGRIPLYKRGSIPDAQELGQKVDDRMTELFDETLDSILEGILSKDIEKGLMFIDGKDLVDGFKEDVERDLALLRGIRDEWDVSRVTADPKFDQFAATVTKALAREPLRKIIVFSEFADTAEYLAANLAKTGLRVLSYSSSLATPTLKTLIRMNFDAGASEKADDYDVLVATDAISEGFSLHRAGAIYNYDIPYNPTRVIQRVGRINRVNQKSFDELHIYNFFPTVTGEAVTGIRTISTFKIAMIQAILGSDTKVLTSGEETGSWFTERFKAASAADETLSWDAEYLNILDSVRFGKKEELLAARTIPKRARIAREGREELVLFSKKGTNYRFVLSSKNASGTSFESRVIPPAEAFARFRAERDEAALETDDVFQNLYRSARAALGEKAPVVPEQKLKSKVTGLLGVLESNLGEGGDAEYVRSVIALISELDALPESVIGEIKGINPNKTAEALAALRECVPEWYVAAIRRRIGEIEGTNDEIILSEQFLLAAK